MLYLRKNILFLFVAIFSLANVVAQNTITPQNTIEIEPDDSEDIIIQKSANVVPAKNQFEALQNEFIAFIHFGINTFTRMEWGNGNESPDIFDLKELDTDRWCRVIKDAGMKMVILTVKHHDGFVLWQSRYTKHGVMSSSFQNGKGDILKSLSESCKKFGLKLGVYLSPVDLYQIENPDGLYGNLSEYTKRTIPRAVSGRPFENKTTFEFEVDDYNEYFLNQLFEILTEYGEIHEVWFDGAHPKTKGGQRYNYSAWTKLIRTLAPRAVIFGREDIRWCGNESGATRKTEWNVIPYQFSPHSLSTFPDMTNDDLGSRSKLYNAKYLHYQQAETNTSIREGWFYRDDTYQKVRSADDVFDIYERAVGGNSTFLLNIPPNREGRFSSQDVAVLEETGRRIRETYGINLFAETKGKKELLDGNLNSYYLLEDGENEIVIEMPNSQKINRIVLQEAVDTHGERIEKHAVDAWLNNEWVEVSTATNVGYKRILRFPEITTDKIRIRIIESRLNPAISTVSAHYYRTRPPRLEFLRDKEGMVTISPKKAEFNWKPHGENSIENLYQNYEIFYTTDGSEPTRNSHKYINPIKVENNELRAVAISSEMQGDVFREYFGILKNSWKVISVSSNKPDNDAGLSFDANPETFWQSETADLPHTIVIDLGAKQTISAMLYTPPKSEKPDGMMAKGDIQISDDCEEWKTVEGFEFGNLVNDPTRRMHQFSNAVSTRYVRIVVCKIEGENNFVRVGELDFW